MLTCRFVVKCDVHADVLQEFHLLVRSRGCDNLQPVLLCELDNEAYGHIRRLSPSQGVADSRADGAGTTGHEHCFALRETSDRSLCLRLNPDLLGVRVLLPVRQSQHQRWCTTAQVTDLP
jgi:hypothetical protein